MNHVGTRIAVWAVSIVALGSLVFCGEILSSALAEEAERSENEITKESNAAGPPRAGEIEVSNADVACPEKQAISKYPWNSNCFKDPWISKMQDVDTNAENKVFVIVGCNAGIPAVRFMEQWGNKSGVHDEWSEHLKEQVSSSGTCGQNYRMPEDEDYPDTPAPSTRSTQNPRILCVEPVPRSIELLHDLTEAVFPGDTSIEVIHAAVSDHEGEAYFDNRRTTTWHKGFEFAKISEIKQPGMHVVPRTTVDAMLAKRNIGRIDILTVDTEGHDPAVLKGARNTISKEGGTRLLIFEVHQDFPGTPWGDTSLKSQIDMLDELDFDCWWACNDGLLRRITGCWDDVEEREYWPIGWSNIACVRRGDIWHPIAESFSTLTNSTKEYLPVKRSWKNVAGKKASGKVPKREL